MTNRRNLGELRCMETPIKESREGVREPPCTDNFFFLLVIFTPYLLCKC